MWFSLALATAFFAAGSDAVTKHALKQNSALTISFLRTATAVLMLAPLLFFAEGPTDARVFWESVALAMPLELVAVLSYYKALETSALSLALPFLAFTPVFLLGMGFLILREVPTTLGILGVVMVTGGAYFLQSANGGRSNNWFFLWPKEKGPRYMLLTAFLFSITSVLGKRAMMASSPVYFSFMYNLIFCACIFLLRRREQTSVWSEWKKRTGLFTLLGGIDAAHFLLQFTVFKYAEVAYVISIKRLSLLLAVFYGRIFFNEENTLSRALGAAFMIAGAAMIAFA